MSPVVFSFSYLIVNDFILAFNSFFLIPTSRTSSVLALLTIIIIITFDYGCHFPVYLYVSNHYGMLDILCKDSADTKIGRFILFCVSSLDNILSLVRSLTKIANPMNQRDVRLGNCKFIKFYFTSVFK